MPSAPAYPSAANGHHIVNAPHNSMGMTNGQGGLNSSVSPHHHHGPTHAHGPTGHGSANNASNQPLTNEDCGIREVWANNLEDEFKIIQLGLTFMDENGKTPSGYSTWQFNFKFNLNEDMYAQESIDLLTNSGIQFKKHEEEGIDTNDFAVLLIGSGVVLQDNIYWLSFHSGYDFGYLLRLLTAQLLPVKVNEFFDSLKIYFPRIYDLKYLMKSTKDLKGGLQEVAEQLDLERKGPQHQAGSDSLLTGETFFKMREIFFEDNIEEIRYSGFIYGLKIVERNLNGPIHLGKSSGSSGSTGTCADNDDKSITDLNASNNGTNESTSNGSSNGPSSSSSNGPTGTFD
ncbi:hypothetical protein RDWZM_008457 [Blomia tropicalis]|uniref:poly(A)-specific ribonuclease n=1 Tax=Blomia tropicalis TaxID=40697 RepID=A0A9Q0RKC8_BLOTA|nr:hypothetical protein RDWZM_008457 [Blomia tropicalis]